MVAALKLQNLNDRNMDLDKGKPRCLIDIQDKSKCLISLCV